MKLVLAILASVVFSNIAYCQTVSSAEQEIEQIIKTNGYEGHDEKIVGRMGDAAAVVVTKVLAGKNLNANETAQVLLILRMAFAAPRIVEVESDRQPRTTLFVLKSLESSTQDLNLKREIIDTEKYVQEQYANYAKSAQSSPKR